LGSCQSADASGAFEATWTPRNRPQFDDDEKLIFGQSVKDSANASLEDAFCFTFPDLCDEVQTVHSYDALTGITFQRTLVECFEELQRPDGDAIEFRARSGSGISAETCFSVICNDEVLAERVPLGGQYRVYRFLGRPAQPVWSICLNFEPCLDPGTATVADENSQCAAQLDPEFGLRLRGEDLLHSAVVENQDSWWTRGAAKCSTHRRARAGFFDTWARYSVANALEFLAQGLSGRETLDIFVNGFSVELDSGLRVARGGTPQYFRYSLGPASCTVCNVVIRVGRDDDSPEHCNSGKFGVVIDQLFGIMVAGQDCLCTALCIGDEDGRQGIGYKRAATCYCRIDAPRNPLIGNCWSVRSSKPLCAEITR